MTEEVKYTTVFVLLEKYMGALFWRLRRVSLTKVGTGDGYKFVDFTPTNL